MSSSSKDCVSLSFEKHEVGVLLHALKDDLAAVWRNVEVMDVEA